MLNFLIFCQNYQKICFEYLARNFPLIGNISEVSLNLLNFQWRLSAEEVITFFIITWSNDQWVAWRGGQDFSHPKSQRLQWEQQNSICITNWGKLRLQIRAPLFYYKLGQTLLSNWDYISIKNWSKCCYKFGTAFTKYDKRYYKTGQLLQIGEKFLTNWDRYYK